ncbi:MAG: nuclear transport factor 2 family protein [Hyphomicrobiales bacterium]|nr:nuclear transport factor 2 family protein [Hyphomicrobiales bacterium]
MTNPRDIAQRYIATWNETDPDERMTLLRSGWAEDASYADPMAKVAGAEALGALIGGVHDRFPGFRFALIGEPDGHGDYVRLAWSLGPEGVPAPIEGSDVVTVANGRIASVVGFLDKVPQAA